MHRLFIALVFVALGALHSYGDVPPPTRLYLPLLLHGRPNSLLISALIYDGYLVGEPDEAFRLFNAGHSPVELAGWRVSAGNRTAVFPSGVRLGPRESLWCSRSASAFKKSWGELPICEYAEDSDPSVPNLEGGALQFANTGSRIVLADRTGKQVDVLVYKAGDTSGGGWQGPAVTAYRPVTSFPEAGQVLYRKPDEHGLPSSDGDFRGDWAQDPDDLWRGRKVLYPGWNLPRFFVPAISEEDARLDVIITPDNSYASLSALVRRAISSVRLEGYTFESAELAELLAERARAGAAITMLLESGPPGGVTEQQRWCVQQIEQAGGRVYYLRADGSGIRERYVYQHAKFWLLDERLALVGSENPSPESFPADDLTDGTQGRRGVYVVTDAAGVIARLQEIMADDLDPVAHSDIWRWDPADVQLGAPSPEFEPERATPRTGYDAPFRAPLSVHGRIRFEVVLAPEAAVEEHSGWSELLSRAGAADVVLVEALEEPAYWGPSTSNVATDPNPRVQAYLAAARRGARVRVLLDSFFDDQDLDDPRSNLRTVEYLNSVARQEGLDLEARRGNPTKLGLHNKMILTQVDGDGWVMAGSLNGGESSAKLNREVSLILRSASAYEYLTGVFWHDWELSPEFR